MYRKSLINIYLENNFSFEEAKSEVDFVLEILFDYTYKDFLVGKKLDEMQKQKAEKIIRERVNTHRPIQQILGQAFFYNRRFLVNEFTLIPRPETEILVQETLKIAQTVNNPKILDIGTGSGCIPITLVMENKNITAHSVDISKEALELAEKNALFHNILDNIKFFHSDLFSNVDEKYNIIVSNPPYIPIKDKEKLQIEVKNFDPELALFAYDENGIEIYEKIIKSAGDYLYDNGYILFEIGINQSELLKNLLQLNKYKNIRIIKDFNNIDRIVIAQK